MGLFRSAKASLQAKEFEEGLYGIVANEIANGTISQGLFAKALAASDGDAQKAKARYIKLRVDMLRTQGAAMVEFAQAVDREQVVEIEETAPVAQSTPTSVPNTFPYQWIFVAAFVGLIWGGIGSGWLGALFGALGFSLVGALWVWVVRLLINGSFRVRFYGVIGIIIGFGYTVSVGLPGLGLLLAPFGAFMGAMFGAFNDS
jgi:hypothetical protein